MEPKKRLFTPGPTMLPERVRLAMAQDILHHRKSEFKAVMARNARRLGLLFGTDQPVLPLTASGSGAMDAAVAGLFAPGETVLVVNGGIFAQRWIAICQTYGVHCIPLDVPWGEAVKPAALEEALRQHPEASGVLCQLSETSTGVLHPVRAIAKITSNSAALLVVDGISGVGVSPCPMDAWGIDCLLTGSQKGLMLPPGLALVALSARAWKKAETVPPKNFYYNLLVERDNAAKQQTHFTPAVSLLVGLDESLSMFEEFGLEAVFRKQWALTMMTRASVAALGLELFAKKHFAWGVTSLMLPAGVEASALLAHAAKEYGVYMAAGQGHLKNSMIRIGHMGHVDHVDMLGCLHALAASFTACGGYLGARSYLEQGIWAYEKAMRYGCPEM